DTARHGEGERSTGFRLDVVHLLQPAKEYQTSPTSRNSRSAFLGRAAVAPKRVTTRAATRLASVQAASTAGRPRSAGRTPRRKAGRSAARSPATKPSPAPVVSTTSTLWPRTQPVPAPAAS